MKLKYFSMSPNFLCGDLGEERLWSLFSKVLSSPVSSRSIRSLVPIIISIPNTWKPEQRSKRQKLSISPARLKTQSFSFKLNKYGSWYFYSFFHFFFPVVPFLNFELNSMLLIEFSYSLRCAHMFSVLISHV